MKQVIFFLCSRKMKKRHHDSSLAQNLQTEAGDKREQDRDGERKSVLGLHTQEGAEPPGSIVCWVQSQEDSGRGEPLPMKELDPSRTHFS